jgi:hypothetical protein
MAIHKGLEVDHAGVGGGENTRVWLAEGPRTCFPTWTRLSVPSICTSLEKTDMGLPTVLLGSKPHQRFIGRAGVSPILAPTPKLLSGALLGSPVVMLLESACHVAQRGVTERYFTEEARLESVWHSAHKGMMDMYTCPRFYIYNYETPWCPYLVLAHLKQLQHNFLLTRRRALCE